MSYQRVIIEKYGGPEVLKSIKETTLPEPKTGEVRIKVLKTSANFTDVMIRKGKYPEVKEKPPFALGYDMVGIIDKKGDGAHTFELGQRVADLTVIGAYSQYICIPEDRLTAVPESLDSSEAVSLILSYTTAYQLLYRVAQVKRGQSILIHGASGAVGIAMLQLGQIEGLEMVGTASESKHDILTTYGATAIDYNKEDFAERIKTLTKKGVDAVFDPIGGSHFKRSFKCLKPGGKLLAYGFYNAVMGKGGNIPLDFMRLMFWNALPNRRKASFYSIGALRKKHPEWFRQDLQKLFDLLAHNQIKPVIAKHHPLEKAREVHQLIEKAQVRGKIIFDVGDEE